MYKLVLLSKMISPYNSIFPGNLRNVLLNYTRIPLGDVSNSYVALIHSHNGTHLDVPFHFFEDGKKTDRLFHKKFDVYSGQNS